MRERAEYVGAATIGARERDECAAQVVTAPNTEPEALQVVVNAKALVPLEGALAKERQDLAKQRQDLAKQRQNLDASILNAHARNSDHVILHLERGVLVGEDGFLVFEIQNRSGSPYQLASVRVLTHRLRGGKLQMEHLGCPVRTILT